ncbi:MAG: 16S rRNA (adenine(1518)-N(6)/adenine(1519)-N(6))-dimethyltransferase, partial [Clostridia bacterium]|nr:16S rRNA (adenine(1518)-N(6)/adenine(1519)-N(6))-dimethyltransferase [Clostridia bacterium]
VSVINADILKTDIADLIKKQFSDCEKVCVCANLPYYITSPIIMALLEGRLPIDGITVMVQKEVAQRMCAPVGSRESGAVTVAVRYYSEPEMLFEVSRGSFMPAPNVDSAVLRLNIRKTPAVQVHSEEFFFKFVKAAFGQRRKTLVNSVGNGLGISKDTVTSAVSECGLSPTVRAEALTMEQLGAVSDKIYSAIR